jgi:hypothetical protein
MGLVGYDGTDDSPSQSERLRELLAVNLEQWETVAKLCPLRWPVLILHANIVECIAARGWFVGGVATLARNDMGGTTVAIL